VARPLCNRGRGQDYRGRARNARARTAADIKTGDIILAVGGREVSELSTMFRKVWSLGNSGVEVPLLIYRDGRTFEAKVKSSDRAKFPQGAERSLAHEPEKRERAFGQDYAPEKLTHGL